MLTNVEVKATHVLVVETFLGFFSVALVLELNEGELVLRDRAEVRD